MDDRVIGVDAYNFNITGDIACTLNATSCDSPSHSGPSVIVRQEVQMDDRVKPTCFRGDSITSPLNYSNPVGGVCHTLSNDSRNYVVIPVACFRPKTANCTEYTEDDKSATLTLGYHYGGGAMQH